MFSFGFQQAYRRGLKPEDHIFFTKVRLTLMDRGRHSNLFQCLTTAKSVVLDMIEGLIPSGYMRYAPDGKKMRSQPIAGLTNAIHRSFYLCILRVSIPSQSKS
jgi:hypothetical protein